MYSRRRSSSFGERVDGTKQSMGGSRCVRCNPYGKEFKTVGSMPDVNLSSPNVHQRPGTDTMKYTDALFPANRTNPQVPSNAYTISQISLPPQANIRSYAYQHAEPTEPSAPASTRQRPLPGQINFQEDFPSTNPNENVALSGRYVLSVTFLRYTCTF